MSSELTLETICDERFPETRIEMFVEFECRCGHEFRTQTQNVGLSIVCPNCMTKSIVPNPNSKSAVDGEDDESQVTQLIQSDWPVQGRPAIPASQPDPPEVSPAAEHVHHIRSKPKTSRRSKRQQSRSNRSSDKKDHSIGSASVKPKQSVILDVEPIDELPPTLPNRRKKKFSNSDASEKKNDDVRNRKNDGDINLPFAIGIIIAGLCVMGLIGFYAFPILIAAMKQVKEGEKLQLPQEFEKFVDNEIFFSCEVPKGWGAEPRGGSGNIPPSVRIEKDRVKIFYRSSNSGAAIQDMAQAGANRSGEVADDLKPVARVHSFQREKISHEMTNYKEIGAAEKIETGWGEGRVSEFTATHNYGSTIYAYRVTLLTTNYQWNIICQCPSKREFEAYKPMFRRIIQSTGR